MNFTQSLDKLPRLTAENRQEHLDQIRYIWQILKNSGRYEDLARRQEATRIIYRALQLPSIKRVMMDTMAIEYIREERNKQKQELEQAYIM